VTSITAISNKYSKLSEILNYYESVFGNDFSQLSVSVTTFQSFSTYGRDLRRSIRRRACSDHLMPLCDTHSKVAQNVYSAPMAPNIILECNKQVYLCQCRILAFTNQELLLFFNLRSFEALKKIEFH